MNSNTNIGFAVQHSNQLKHAHYFKDHIYGIPDFSFNRLNKKDLATASFDNNINIYDIEKLIYVKTLSGHEKGVWCCEYSNNDSLLVSGSNDCSFILWDTISYKNIAQVKNYHDDTIYDVVFNDKIIATCSKGKVFTWDSKKLDKPLSSFEFDNKFILSLAFIENKLIAGFINGTIAVLDYSKNKILSELKIPFPNKPEENLDSGNGVIFSLYRYIILRLIRIVKIILLLQVYQMAQLEHFPLKMIKLLRILLIHVD